MVNSKEGIVKLQALQMVMATEKSKPICAANLLGAWSVIFGLMEKTLISLPLNKFSRLYLPSLKARAEKSITKKTGTNQKLVSIKVTVSTKMLAAVSLALFSSINTKSTGHAIVSGIGISLIFVQ